jgi:O-antigen ligase
VLLLMYVGVIVVGFMRAVFDRSNIEYYPLKNLISEELINTIKWVLPGILLFGACRMRKHVILAFWSLLGLYFLIALQVVYRVPWACALGGTSEGLFHTRAKGCAQIGYNACDISTFLAGASWGILAALPLVRQKKHKLLVLACAGIVAFGQALTGGRAGYLAWGATGVVLCLIKWRKYLILAPVIVILLPIVLPGAAERMLTGFGVTNVAGETTVDDYSLTSGRILFWPRLIDKIGESPVVGYGRLAMRRTGLVESIETEYPGIGATQPHNMYLETLLDNGILGSIPIFLFWAMTVVYCARLFRSDNRLYSAVGGLALSLILAQLFAGIGSQHFYPEESTLGTWVAVFLMLRVHVEEKQVQIRVNVADDFCCDSHELKPQSSIAAESGQA